MIILDSLHVILIDAKQSRIFNVCRFTTYSCADWCRILIRFQHQMLLLKNSNFWTAITWSNIVTEAVEKVSFQRGLQRTGSFVDSF